MILISSVLGEGNGNPLQYSCLENPVDGGVWWAAVCRASQSQIRLMQLSIHGCTREGNGNPLQCSCLENPRDRGAWWAATYGVAQSPPRLKWLSSSSSRSRGMHKEDVVHIYHGILLSHKQGFNNAIYSNMIGYRHYPATWNK